VVTLDDRLHAATTDLHAATTAAEPAAPPRSRRPLLLAAAVVVAVVLVTALTTRPDREGARVTTDEPPSPTTTVAPAAATDATTVVRWRDRWWAAGAVYGEPGFDLPVVWSSDDGTTWDEAWRNPDDPGGSGMTSHLYVDGDARLVLVAVGTGGTQAWHTPDGRHWQPTSSYFPNDWFRDAVPFQGRLYAIGTSKTKEFNHLPDTLAFLDAGSSWQVVDTGLPPGFVFDRLLVVGDELVLAAALDGQPGEVPVVVTHSADGRRWSDPVRLSDEAAWVDALATSKGTTLAAVRTKQNRVTLLRSTDLEHWEEVVHSDFYGVTNLMAMVATSDGFALLGSDGLVRVSAYGSDWRIVDDGGAGNVVAVGDDTMVVITGGNRWTSRVVHLRG
jgi:hypothetical protein